MANASHSIPTFSILGPPGCGKGTQAEFIKSQLGFLHVSSGDIFRGALARGDENALAAQDLMQRGELVPDEVIKKMVHDELQRILKASENAKGVLLDGFPRTVGQAEMMDDLLSDLGLHFVGMLNLQVPEALLIERLLKRGQGAEKRPDDNEDVIRERMRVWKEKTYPLEEYYEAHKQLFSLDGVGSPDEVFGRLKPVIVEQGQLA
ncbi:MAG: adenylate kinase [bacterium]|nr:adenylate kinase [bacterium]